MHVWDGATRSDVDSESQAGDRVEQDVFRDDYASLLACAGLKHGIQERKAVRIDKRMAEEMSPVGWQRYRCWHCPGRLCCIGWRGPKDAWRRDAGLEHFIREDAH